MSPMLFKFTVAKTFFDVKPGAITKGPPTFALRGAANVVLTLIVIGAARLLTVSRVVIIYFLRD
jgi:hypothetical protein